MIKELKNLQMLVEKSSTTTIREKIAKKLGLSLEAVIELSSGNFAVDDGVRYVYYDSRGRPIPEREAIKFGLDKQVLFEV